jgi:hypothetical protein
VHLDPGEVERVARLSRRNLPAQGAFWREQAERYLADILWVDGRIPQAGDLTLTDLPREAIDLAAAWESD